MAAVLTTGSCKHRDCYCQGSTAVGDENTLCNLLSCRHPKGEHTPLVQGWYLLPFLCRASSLFYLIWFVSDANHCFPFLVSGSVATASASSGLPSLVWLVIFSFDTIKIILLFVVQFLVLLHTKLLSGMRSSNQNLISRMVSYDLLVPSSFFSALFFVSSGSLLRLSKSFFLGIEDYGQVLYVRPCYVTLFNRVQAAWSSRKRVGVFGTPGIGKTFFLIYIFLRLVQVRKWKKEAL
jgi:hypothetical protein